MTDRGNILGIDFGTSKSVIAVMEGNKPTIIPDLQGRNITPSLVMVSPDGTLFIGREALSHPDRYQGHHFTISSIKRQMGKQGEVNWGQLKTYPQEISALILGSLKMQAETYCGKNFSQAVIAVPAHFDINQRWATIQAAEIAGIKVLRLINEASAAVMALRYSSKTREECALIFDFGAGTLDISIIEFGKGFFGVRSTAGDDHLGGDDFDQAIVDYLLEETAREFGISKELSSLQRLVLKEAAARAKVELSSSFSSRIYIPGFFQAAHHTHLDLDVTLSRNTFENLCKPLFTRAQATIRRAISDANVNVKDLTSVFLIGGTSKIPRIRNLVNEETNLPPDPRIDPEIGVAQGACMMAGVLEGTIKGLLFLDVTPSTFSVTTQGDVANPVIERNTTIPTRKTQQFTTTQSNQTEITIRILQGESTVASQNTLAGTITLTGLLPSPSGVPIILVNFDIDANHTINVSASDRATGRQVQTVLESPYRLNTAQVDVLKKKVSAEFIAIQQRAVVERDREQQEAVYKEATSFIEKIEVFLSHGYNLNPEHASLLNAGKNLITNYLNWNSPPDKLLALLTSIRQTYMEAIVSSILNEVTMVGNSPDLMVWATGISQSWSNPTTFTSNFQQFEKLNRPIIDNVVGLVEQLDALAREDIYREVSAKLKSSPQAHIFLAIILGRYAHNPIGIHSIDPNEPQSRLLYTIYLLGMLDKSVPPPLKQMAAKAIYDLLKGEECLFLLKYLLAEKDSETFSCLQNCLRKMPSGCLIRYYHDLTPEKKTSIFANEILLQEFRYHAVQGLISSDKDTQFSAIQVLSELGIGEYLPELLLYSKDRKRELFILPLIDLLSSVPDPRVVIPLLANIRSDDEAINQAILIALEKKCDLMTPDIHRFFDITRKALISGMPKDIGTRIFMWKFLKDFPELKEMSKSLKTRNKRKT